ncbi:hypothetical protein L2E82_08354 [Cichorium intybus]|uniref:Uncharacterized protein n=1 Tax=Cichorium intybus TaxID=13427 RepID=A0ACB9G615_CICIN|nr:hypothetical protein L2E82_08354 [Cichorium intybus]
MVADGVREKDDVTVDFEFDSFPAFTAVIIFEQKAGESRVLDNERIRDDRSCNFYSDRTIQSENAVDDLIRRYGCGKSNGLDNKTIPLIKL